MFGPIKTTSYQRYNDRIEDWKDCTNIFPRLRHHFWWIIHNCIAHILIGLIPIKIFFRFHDYTSDKINAIKLKDEAIEKEIEKIKTFREKWDKK